MTTPNEPLMSYSANFEDVILYRALKNIQHGCYVDVGASNALHDSNTAAFYKKGWRGICVEPLAENIALDWAVSRPDDILVTALAGSAPGQSTLYIYADTPQISTASAEVRAHWNEYQKLPDVEVVVPVFTLNQILEQYLGERTIHLLCIDVEGSEKNVLDGFDLKKYNPWIIVIEATVPGTLIPAHQAWESMILAAGYTMVYQDGINRFYLSNTKLELRNHFMTPPNGWDEFIYYKHAMADEKSAELEKQNQALKTEIAGLKKILAKEVNLPANFWDFVPHVEDVGSQAIIAKLEEANQLLNRQIRGLQQEAALKKFLGT